jgi:hypothetical protein
MCKIICRQHDLTPIAVESGQAGRFDADRVLSPSSRPDNMSASISEVWYPKNHANDCRELAAGWCVRQRHDPSPEREDRAPVIVSCLGRNL